MHIARIGAMKVTRSAAVTQKKRTASEFLAEEPPATTKRTPNSAHKQPDSATKKTSEQLDAEQLKKPRKRAAEDEVLSFVGNDGSIVEFVKLDVQARLSAEQIEEQHRIHVLNRRSYE
jgi:hypothetical protein